MSEEGQQPYVQAENPALPFVADISAAIDKMITVTGIYEPAIDFVFSHWFGFLNTWQTTTQYNDDDGIQMWLSMKANRAMAAMNITEEQRIWNDNVEALVEAAINKSKPEGWTAKFTLPHFNREPIKTEKKKRFGIF
jgi:hypothetical protein